MAKLTYENRIDIYNKIKNSESPTYLAKQYSIGVDKNRYLIRLIDQHVMIFLELLKIENLISLKKK